MKSLVAQYRLAISASLFCLSALSSAGIAQHMLSSICHSLPDAEFNAHDAGGR